MGTYLPELRHITDTGSFEGGSYVSPQNLAPNHPSAGAADCYYPAPSYIQALSIYGNFNFAYG
jgi:hypothetical protein